MFFWPYRAQRRRGEGKKEPFAAPLLPQKRGRKKNAATIHHAQKLFFLWIVGSFTSPISRTIWTTVYASLHSEARFYSKKYFPPYLRDWTIVYSIKTQPPSLFSASPDAPYETYVLYCKYNKSKKLKVYCSLSIVQRYNEKKPVGIKVVVLES